MIANFDMTAKRRVCRQHYVIADNAVMCNVRLGHKQPIVADNSGRLAIQCAMHRHQLPNAVAVTDHQMTACAWFESTVLRHIAQYHVGMNTIVTAYARARIDNAVRTDRRTAADLDTVLNNTIRTDNNIVGKSGTVGDQGGWMDGWHSRHH